MVDSQLHHRWVQSDAVSEPGRVLREAVDFYHGLLDAETAAQSQAELDEQLRRRGLFFAERPLCTVVRPRFLTPEQYRLLRNAVGSVMRALGKAYRAAVANADVRAQFMLTEWEEKLIEVDPGFREPSPTSRMDTFFLPDEHAVHFTEYNAETPAAPAYQDVLSEVFYALPVMRGFERRYEVQPLPGRHHMLHALLEAYREWGGRERPNIAILDWREVPTYSEFVLFQEYFQAHGYECVVISDPREADYRQGKLMVGNIEVTLIYKRVLLSELVAACGLEHAVIRAVSDGAACMVNPFRSKVLHKKASLAFLSDERNSHLFDSEDRRAIDAYVPWTRCLEERHTLRDGGAVDLVPHVVDHKDGLVLKPNDEYGGKGIVLGSQVSQSQWEEAVRHGLSEPTIVQQGVRLPSEPYASVVDGNVEITDRMFDTDPYVWQGSYVSSCLTRLSTVPLLNVTAGGGSTVPTFLLEER